MPAYKKQHFLPLAYLGHFARPPEAELRKRRIWRVSEDHAGEVPVGTQCQEDYFYSKERAPVSEGYFGKVEAIYGALMARLGRGETLPQAALFNFFLSSVDFYARGCKFRVKDEQEEFEYYLKRIDIFKRQLLGGGEDASETVTRDRVIKEWEFAVIPFPAEGVLTSDSPAVWFSHSKSGDLLRGVLMPVTPKACFVGVHRDTYRIVAKSGSGDDAQIVSTNEIANCVNAVYFSDSLSADEIAIVRKLLAKRTVQEPNRTAWAFELVDYDLNPTLSFIVPR